MNTGRPSSTPASPEAERAILGAFLLKPILVEDARAAGLRPEDFSLDSHRRIYERMLALLTSDRPLDTITLMEELRDHRELDRIGGVAYLADITDLVITERKHMLYRVAIVMTKARLRRIMRIGERAMEAASEPGAHPERLAEDIVTALAEITDAKAVVFGRGVAESERQTP
jgi:replicative DNA helicase